ncbi:hypothetical protein [Dysosmobacter sp.]|uniref:hypothetical protein n=1 Tax=Dysosmobacter sp. TaxID=2591382 RepID=UPI002A8B17C1|nr:hypothetical protein [Dysosmobacter sp.]MDY3984716.1 hypothetical protein [Dysosmobacter sp.]
MYNRYIRNDNGSYTRIPQEEDRQQGPSRQEQAQQQAPPPPPPTPESEHRPPPGGEPRRPQPPPPPIGVSPPFTDGLSGFLRHILDQLHLDHVDTGDLLLLGLLFFLFREEADEELLVALGLLLIL